MAGTFLDSFLPAVAGDLAQVPWAMAQGQLQGEQYARNLALLDMQLKAQQLQNMQAERAMQQPQRPAFHNLGSGSYAMQQPTGEVQVFRPPLQPERPIALAPGGTLVRPSTGETVATGQTKPDVLTTDQRNAQAMGLTLEDYLTRKATTYRIDPNAALDPKTLDFMAQQALAGDVSVYQNLGRGMQGARNLVALRNRIQQMAGQQGVSPTELATRGAEYQGLKAGERVLGGRTATFGMAVNEAMQMADLVTQASNQFQRGNYPLANIALRSYETQTGDTNVVKFGAALNSFINAYARAISPTGVPTVADKEHARQMLNTAQTKDQVDAVIGQLKLEMEAAGRAPGMVRQEFRKGMMGTEPPMKPSGTRQAQTPYTPGSYPPPKGSVQRGYRFKGGDPSNKANWEPVK